MHFTEAGYKRREVKSVYFLHLSNALSLPSSKTFLNTNDILGATLSGLV